ncbi:hypothetical protein VTK73DRAFT_7865 [Phialemonium thermophilum]|uniref:Gfo/Idh/MocA-like oxidoreductase N-terminal domain-containing protein n=1 Tax=Phialemonium thermophilum TaxID=223376 RepID=A0ABR3WC07_9PEZI
MAAPATSASRIALLGGGIFAREFYLPVLAKSTEVVLDSIWSRSQASVDGMLKACSAVGLSPQAFVGAEGFEQLLKREEIKGVIMALSITSHPDYILRCLEAGKSVMSEKPIAKDVETAKQLIAIYEKKYQPRGLDWRIAENFTHEPILWKARDILKDPALGPVLYWQLAQEICCPDGNPWHATEWRNIPDYQGGFILDGGVHNAALLRAVLPDLPERIISVATLHRSHLPPHDTVMGLALAAKSAAKKPYGRDIGDISRIPVKPGLSSPTGTITMTWAAPDTKPNGRLVLHVACLNGKVLIEFEDGIFSVKTVPAAGSAVKEQLFEGPHTGVAVEVDMFGRAIRNAGSEEHYGHPRDATWDLAVIQALVSSDGKEVDLPTLVGK